MVIGIQVASKKGTMFKHLINWLLSLRNQSDQKDMKSDQ